MTDLLDPDQLVCTHLKALESTNEIEAGASTVFFEENARRFFLAMFQKRNLTEKSFERFQEGDLR
jgi:hypothetical protein